MLPANIIQDILSRLDVKTLIRLRCVCKSWFNLISTPSFQDLHRSRSHHNLLFLFRSNSPSHKKCLPNHFLYPFCSIDIAGTLCARFVVKVDDPIKLVLPTCFGLVCFATHTSIYVCNPAARQIISLPCHRGSSIAGFGFGYVGSGYKVVRLILRSIHKIECSVSTINPGFSGPHSWRVLEEGCPYLVEQFSYPVFAKDNIYWKINRKFNLRRSDDYLVCFDVKKEKFSTVTHPVDWNDVACNSTQLADLGGLLCMVEISNSNVVIWVLKDHLSSFWHKGGCIDITGIDRSVMGEAKCLKNGEIIFSSLANLLLFYDVKKKTFRRVQLPFSASEFGIYWESFF